ncbi:PIN domain-containing protein [Actinacidiphila glaucinigra]|uniref:PIN domain-containing protein n=1 Tax=Actinacidiphila glaucinigra TaxID=235986 RepID=UPI003D8D47AE
MTGVRADREYEPFLSVLRRTFRSCPALDDPWRRIHAVQRDLIAIGHHRGPSPRDILIALTAEAHGLTLIHADQDFASVAEVRPGIPMIRVDRP